MVCCTFCQIEGRHKNHKILHIHEAEDIDKRSLCRLQQKVDEYGEKYIKSRSDVQKAIEETKRNDVRVQDILRRYFRELRMAIEHGEKIILEEAGKRNKATLRSLNEQLRWVAVYWHTLRQWPHLHVLRTNNMCIKVRDFVQHFMRYFISSRKNSHFIVKHLSDFPVK